ncbi:MAG: hypothetical protein IJL70_08595 [Treponema sp.]|nr:hypothetical protein [Treponema sp.]
MQDILRTNGSSILLNSSLSEEQFAKTKCSRLLDETGYSVLFKSENKELLFTPWKFSGTKTIDEQAYFFGEWEEAVSAEDIIFKGGQQAKQTLFFICRAYSEADKKNIELPCNGMAGILVKKDELLFVPEKTFDRCAMNLGKDEYNRIQNLWRDSIAEGSAARNFTLSVCAYYACTGHFPYPDNTDSEKGILISDRNFLPLIYSVNGISKKLSEFTTKALSGNKPETDFPLEDLKKELFNLESEKHRIPPEQFEKDVKNFVIKQKKNLSRKKFFERNRTKIIVIFAVLAFIVISARSIYVETGKKPTAIGLTSSQTAELFYAGIHHMDTDYMLAAAKNCPQAQIYISQIPQIYVTSQMKGAYNFDSGISTPENWLFYEPDSKKSYSRYVYGITCFQIDGASSELNQKAPTVRNHSHRITRSSEGKKIELKPEASHTVHYYLVHTDNTLLRIDEYTTKVSAEYKKDRWQILSLDQKQNSSYVPLLDFSLAYKESLNEADGNVIQSVENLRAKYPWLPTRASLEDEQNRLDAIGY